MTDKTETFNNTENMKKKSFNHWLWAALLCGLSLSVTSCKDDDNDNNSTPSAEEQAAEQANEFWAVVTNLVSPFDVTSDYANKTFEPTIGEPAEGDDATRVVILPDAQAAATHFAAIADADITASTATYTYKSDAVGTLVYTKSTDGKSLATVDVDIKQIPHLQKIVYRTADQAGTNGVSDGVPYYSFGDVIKRTREDGIVEYWMCIQAPITKQGSTEVIWASLSQLPKENIYTKKSDTNGKTYKLPTGLGSNKEYIKNLSEMIFAMVSPAKWESNLKDGPDDMKAFNLVKKENIKYINQYFWKRVMDSWEELSLGQTIFGKGVTLLDMAAKINDNTEGMKIVYNGYSWWGTTNSPTLWTSILTAGSNNEANGRHLDWISVKKQVIDPYIALDCVSQLKFGSQWINEEFFGDDEPRYIFRFAKTKDLAGIKMNIWESMESHNGIKNVYVYTKKYNIQTGEHKKMDDNIVSNKDMFTTISSDEAKVGKIIAADGKFCDNLIDAEDNHGGAVAVVAYVGDKMRVEDGEDWNGLAIGITSGGSEWNTGSGINCAGLHTYNEAKDAMKMFNGLASTNLMKKCNMAEHGHEAVEACKNYYSVNLRMGNISEWFLPSVGQYCLAIEGLGGKVEGDTIKIDREKLAEMSADALDLSLWTSSPHDSKTTYCCQNQKKIQAYSNTSKKQFVPFIAFKYNGGGTQNQNK